MARSKGRKSGNALRQKRGAPAEQPKEPAIAPEIPPNEDIPEEEALAQPAGESPDPGSADPWESFEVKGLGAGSDEGDRAFAGRAFAPPSGAPIEAIPASAPAVVVESGPTPDVESAHPAQEAQVPVGAPRPEAEEATLDLLCFRVADEEFAIDIHRVWEIIRPRPVTDLPRVPGFISGIISLRGQIVPVMDLRARLGFPPAEVPLPSAKIIVATYEGKPIGMSVDAVSQKVRVSESKMDVPPSVLGAQESGFLRGVCRHQGGLFAVLNPDAVLAFEVSGPGSGSVHAEDPGSRGECS
ncbi:MAG: hypothetical protein A2Y95_06050 [Deltaproteobacteria bacterium RBG_13_65_10]|nr:MAG: hypothetical protein A2Y95_06050 [Deltaproteobacteria bacterium RBG_13_65_10]